MTLLTRCEATTPHLTYTRKVRVKIVDCSMTVFEELDSSKIHHKASTCIFFATLILTMTRLENPLETKRASDQRPV